MEEKILEIGIVQHCLLPAPAGVWLIVHHIAGSSNLLHNVFFISICVGGFVK